MVAWLFNAWIYLKCLHPLQIAHRYTNNEIIYYIKRLRIVLGIAHTYTSWTNQELNAKEISVREKVKLELQIQNQEAILNS